MSPSGLEIGQLIASDPDKNQTLKLTLQNDADGRFKIEDSYLKVSTVSMIFYIILNYRSVDLHSDGSVVTRLRPFFFEIYMAWSAFLTNVSFSSP